MGGRGASFSKNFGEGMFNFNSGSRIDSFSSDKPIPESEMTPAMKELKQHNIITYKSMQRLPKEMLDQQIESLLNATKQNKFIINLIDKNNPLNIQLATFDNTYVQACFSRTIDFSNLKILFNASFVNKNVKQIEKMTKEQQDKGWWVKCDKENLAKQVATHEFGHFIQYNAIKKIIDRRYGNQYKKLLNDFENKPSAENRQNVENLYIKIAHQINNKIALISKKKYGTMNIKDVSDYGKQNQAEYFAELFANATLSSNPTNMAKALKLYLRGNKK